MHNPRCKCIHLLILNHKLSLRSWSLPLIDEYHIFVVRGIRRVAAHLQKNKGEHNGTPVVMKLYATS